jgi:hypothetical protein
MELLYLFICLFAIYFWLTATNRKNTIQQLETDIEDLKHANNILRNNNI